MIVFAPKGEKFTLYLGNTRQNDEPSARVEASNPGGPNFKIRVVMEDPSAKELSKLVFNKPHSTIYYKVGRNPKGVFVLESVTTEWSEVSDGEVKTAKQAAGAVEPDEEKEKPVESPGSGQTDGDCANPMSEADFAVSLAGISHHPFEASRLSAAKKMAGSKCLMVWQVKQIIGVFDMEASRLSFAKFAYDHTYNRGEYEEVRDALYTEKSKADLDKFLKSKK